MSTHTVFAYSQGADSRGLAAKGSGHSSPEIDAFSILREYFQALLDALGPQKWWPGKTRFEIIVGAILTQNTNWTNVERAIRALRRAGLLTAPGIAQTPVNKLAKLIRSSGYFRQKARKLQEFVRFLKTEHDGSLNKMFGTATAELREQLLGVHGIGPETADSILLYAGEHPVFVVDAYTRRILTRHEIVPEKSSYEEIRGLMEKSLPPSVTVYNEFHALIVNVGKHYCRPTAPNCTECPLNCFLPQPIERAR